LYNIFLFLTTSIFNVFFWIYKNDFFDYSHNNTMKKKTDFVRATTPFRNYVNNTNLLGQMNTVEKAQSRMDFKFGKKKMDIRTIGFKLKY